MDSTITTTIRWSKSELDDVKKASKDVGLPVSLFIKSLALSKVRSLSLPYDNNLVKELLLAQKDLKERNIDVFHSKEDLINDLKSNLKK